MVEEIKDNNLKFTNINIEKKLDAVKKDRWNKIRREGEVQYKDYWT